MTPFVGEVQCRKERVLHDANYGWSVKELADVLGRVGYQGGKDFFSNTPFRDEKLERELSPVLEELMERTVNRGKFIQLRFEEEEIPEDIDIPLRAKVLRKDRGFFSLGPRLLSFVYHTIASLELTRFPRPYSVPHVYTDHLSYCTAKFGFNEKFVCHPGMNLSSWRDSFRGRKSS